ncbi:MAG: hypothetical protein PHF17_10385 [Arcobacteraceae bacterium]|nr:hypothetical protein [Arcobacteraceae bacterium]
MRYRKFFLICIVVIGLNNCGGSSATNEIDDSDEINTHPITQQPTTQATIVNNEAISFPKSANQTSVPTDQLPKN